MNIINDLKLNKKLEGCYKKIAQLEIDNEILRVNNETLTNNVNAKTNQIKDLTETHNILIELYQDLKNNNNF